jgi:diacylglycerol kinase (ATP)
MSENKKLLFIINKYAGTGYQSSVEGRIVTYCQAHQLEPVIEFTQGPKHATLLAQEGASTNVYNVIYAVGGDGTVNEVAQGLVHTKQTMGIIPNGSGNGLARHLGIPMNFKKSLGQITDNHIVSIDSLLINDKLSVNVSGIGFDGHIASLFAKGKKRGLMGYSKFILKEFLAFKEFPIEATIDHVEYKRDGFVLAFANSSQFGNNARVSPQASVCDGWLDVCFIRKVPIVKALGFTQQMFTGHLDQSPLVDIVKGKKIRLSFSRPMPYHVDGEGMKPAKEFSVEILPSSIDVIIPKTSIGHV